MKQSHKDNISKAKKGIHLNESRGKRVLVDGKKYCAGCKSWKETKHFGKRLDRPIGLRAKCKECEILYRSKNIESTKFTDYKSGAKRRGIKFNLTKEQFMTLWQVSCNYCGDEIETIGIDRINSNECYNIENIVPCCAICNTMKLALPRDIFISHCEKVVRHSN